MFRLAKSAVVKHTSSTLHDGLVVIDVYEYAYVKGVDAMREIEKHCEKRKKGYTRVKFYRQTTKGVGCDLWTYTAVWVKND